MPGWAGDTGTARRFAWAVNQHPINIFIFVGATRHGMIRIFIMSVGCARGSFFYWIATPLTWFAMIRIMVVDYDWIAAVVILPRDDKGGVQKSYRKQQPYKYIVIASKAKQSSCYKLICGGKYALWIATPLTWLAMTSGARCGARGNDEHKKSPKRGIFIFLMTKIMTTATR